jgi:hypothetical protein
MLFDTKEAIPRGYSLPLAVPSTDAASGLWRAIGYTLIA